MKPASTPLRQPPHEATVHEMAAPGANNAPGGAITAVLKRASKLQLTAIGLFATGVLLAVIAGASRSIPLKDAALIVIPLSALCIPLETIIIGARSLHARRSDPRGVPAELHDTVTEVASKAGIAPPRVKVVRDETPNARVGYLKSPSVIINRGLLDLCSTLALIGAVGHEIGHIAAGHAKWIRAVGPLTTLDAIAVAALIILCKAGAVSFIWPLSATIAALAVRLVLARVSRRHEFEADRIGAELTGVDAQLAALNEITRQHRAPGRGPLGTVELLFLTHPTFHERRAALERITSDAAGR